MPRGRCYKSSFSFHLALAPSHHFENIRFKCLPKRNWSSYCSQLGFFQASHLCHQKPLLSKHRFTQNAVTTQSLGVTLSKTETIEPSFLRKEYSKFRHCSNQYRSRQKISNIARGQRGEGHDAITAIQDNNKLVLATYFELVFASLSEELLDARHERERASSSSGILHVHLMNDEIYMATLE